MLYTVRGRDSTVLYRAILTHYPHRWMRSSAQPSAVAAFPFFSLPFAFRSRWLARPGARGARPPEGCSSTSSRLLLRLSARELVAQVLLLLRCLPCLLELSSSSSLVRCARCFCSTRSSSAIAILTAPRRRPRPRADGGMPPAPAGSAAGDSVRQSDDAYDGMTKAGARGSRARCAGAGAAGASRRLQRRRRRRRQWRPPPRRHGRLGGSPRVEVERVFPVWCVARKKRLFLCDTALFA